MRELVQALLSVTAHVLVIGLMVSAIVLMINPARGRQLLNNVAVAASLFLAGLMLFQWCLGGSR